ncbi:MAG: acyl-CoA dehydratase activase-related protein [Clostridia bacterium]|nr:acyl-CoA dehydratase activase-related protein [Clostridia bacterium]
MSWRIGLPRALFYHTYFPLWSTFFESLGVEVIVSPQTNKAILDQGVRSVVDETCLPVKVFFGHVAALGESETDFLFVPRLISVERKAYICPKFMGLPDMLSASKIKHSPLIKPVINKVRSVNGNNFLWDCASPFTGKWSKIKKAWQEAKQEQERYEQKLIRKHQDISDLNILVLGHDYNLYDHYVNMDLLKKLQDLGCSVITPAQISKEERDAQLKNFPKSIFWTYGRNLLGAVYSFMQKPGKKGVIILSSFGCGIDSFIDNLIMRRLTEYKIPYLNIILDEHTGEGGLITRIEAFVDIIYWRRDCHQNHFSPYGQYVGSCKGNAGIHGVRCNCTTTPH